MAAKTRSKTTLTQKSMASLPGSGIESSDDELQRKLDGTQRMACIHKCDPNCKTSYAGGRSSGWRMHIEKVSSKIHPNCSEDCPGWSFLRKKLSMDASPATSPNSSSAADLAIKPIMRTGRVKLLWVLDPTLQESNEKDMEDNRSWYDIEIGQLPILTPAENRMLNGFWFPKKGTGNRYTVTDYLHMFLQLSEDSFEKHLMEYKTFKNIIQEDQRDRLKAYDIIVTPFIAVDLTKNKYELKTQLNVKKYLEQLQKIEDDGVCFWPSIQESVYCEDKSAQALLLNIIARDVTHTTRPHTGPHEQGIVPSNNEFGFLEVGMLQATDAAWMMCIKETENKVSYEDLKSPKAILGKDLKELVEPWKSDFFILPMEKEENMDAIMRFAKTTLQELIRMEEHRFHRATSLDTFASLEIGIIADENGNAQFYVKRIKRLPAVTLWRKGMSDPPECYALMVGSVLDESLYKHGRKAQDERGSTLDVAHL